MEWSETQSWWKNLVIPYMVGVSEKIKRIFGKHHILDSISISISIPLLAYEQTGAKRRYKPNNNQEKSKMRDTLKTTSNIIGYGLK